MILKGSQRSGGQNLAVHLMRLDDNEHVRLHQLRGFAADDLKGAFKKSEAVSLGTKCRQHLFSLSLSPPETERVPVSAFEDAIDRIEERLGLNGQPRAIVFHEKEGRRHAHCVWSRIDAETMTARPLPFFKRKLMAISRDLYLDYGWTMPSGIAETGNRNPTNFSLAEWQAAKRQGADPRAIKAAAQACWARSDGRKALQRSLEERGLFLAKGDRRGFVLIDYDGSVHALPRLLDVKTKDVRARLGDSVDLPSVAETLAMIRERMKPALRRHIEESRKRFRRRMAKLQQETDTVTQRHRAAREQLGRQHEQEWQSETAARAARLPKGLRGLWTRVTGRYQAIRVQNEAEARETMTRHAIERQALGDRQLVERCLLQAQIKTLRAEQAELLSYLHYGVSDDFTRTRSQRKEC